MFELPDAETAEVIADWVELELAAGEPHLSKAKVAAVLESQTGSEPSEAFVSDIWQKLEERQSRYWRQFFRCEGDLVYRSEEGQTPSEYTACLLYSLYGVSDEYRTDPKIFERLAAAAIKN